MIEVFFLQLLQQNYPTIKQYLSKNHIHVPFLPKVNEIKLCSK